MGRRARCTCCTRLRGPSRSAFCAAVLLWWYRPRRMLRHQLLRRVNIHGMELLKRLTRYFLISTLEKSRPCALDTPGKSKHSELKHESSPEKWSESPDKHQATFYFLRNLHSRLQRPRAKPRRYRPTYPAPT